NEIAQSQACYHVSPAKYWMHTNMLTVNGTRMSKSLGNGFLPEELFTGNHPLLEKDYAPVTVRFFMLQTHYRSTLDFSNEALQASEKGLKRLWDAYETLQKLTSGNGQPATDAELDAKVNKLVNEFDEFMNDDFNTAKVLGSMFELVPVINSIKDGLIKAEAVSSSTLSLMQQKFMTYIEDVFGLKNISANSEALSGVMDLLIDIRKEAKAKRDFATSDKIRNQLATIGIQLKDEKGGEMSWDVN
nr:cysteine--tRNA ligase [Ferruginibacter sp.]